MTGAEAVAQCLSDGAIVIDERQEYRGQTAIARWKAEASAKFRYTVERLGVHVSGDQTTVTGHMNPSVKSQLRTSSSAAPTTVKD